MTDEYKIRKEKLRAVDLYVVTSESASGGRTSLEVLDAVLLAGVLIVQLREKEKTKGDLYRLAVEFRKRTQEAGTLLIINDHVDVALAAGADGVHLGRSDMPIDAARRIAPNLLIGASSHNVEQALDAESAGADYINIGPVFKTLTKPEHKNFVGPAMVAKVVGQVQIPVSCMGGINQSNIARVVGAGPGMVAVVTAVTQAPDMRKATEELRKIIRH
jgi:thiamine-phosphate pyrophosphorylase